MESLKNIKENNKELYNKLSEFECSVLYNGNLLYEGKLQGFNINDINEKYNKSQIVYRINTNDNNIVLLEEENKNISKVNNLFENNEFNSIFNDPKLFNEAMILANELPFYGLEFDEEDVKSKIQKYGMNMQKLYENYYFSNDIEDNTNQVKEDLSYDDIIEKLKEAKEKEMPIDEGVLGSIFGGLAGATVGPKIMRAICNALGVDEKGAFGSLLTSRLILTTIGAKLGWRM
jgi:hypothetical protein